MTALKLLSKFWKKFEMSLIKCEINLLLTWCPNCLISDVVNQATAFAATGTNLYDCMLLSCRVLVSEWIHPL